MEEIAKDQLSSVASGNGPRKSILRYPLRSATKLKDQTSKSPDAANNSVSATHKRGRPPSSVSKSVSVLELSGKDKSSSKAPPRRLSIPTKSSASPGQKPTTASSNNNNITPISEVRAKRSGNGQDYKCDTPRSDVSKSSTRRKFNVLSSSSYWLQQIKLSESASKHSISLAFFKLALEAGSEPLQLLREELKSYTKRHNLADYGDTIRDLFNNYEILETLEQLQVSETCSHVPEGASSLSDESGTSTADTRKLKQKSLNTDTQASSAKVSSRKDNAQRTTAVAAKTRVSVNHNPRVNAESGVNNIKKKVHKSGKQQSNEGEEKIKNDEEKSVVEEVATKRVDMEETLEGNKENLDAPLIGEISVADEN